MSDADKKAIIIISIIKTIAEVTGVTGDKQNETVDITNKVLDSYSGTLNQHDLNKIEYILTEIFKELIKQNFIINADVLYSVMIFFSEKYLQFIKFEPKKKIWNELYEFANDKISKKFDDPLLIDKADEVVDWISDRLKGNLDDGYNKHYKKNRYRKNK
jgi:hypothetical protein